MTNNNTGHSSHRAPILPNNPRVSDGKKHEVLTCRLDDPDPCPACKEVLERRK